MIFESRILETEGQTLTH